MTEFLVRHFVKDYNHTEKVSVRTAYGVLASVTGIFCNVLLFVTKAIIGYLMHSVSVTADAFNNLSDAGSSIISLVSVKIAEKPADKDHPFGHGRVEYIAALVVAFLIMEVGFSFLKDSISKITHPRQLQFQLVSMIILILSVTVKLWLMRFNRSLGTRIDSKVMLATAADSMGDVITTTATILSIIFWKVTGYNIDALVGVGVSLVVMWAAFGIAKDTLKPLLGAPVDPEVYKNISELVEGYDGIVGSHDLIVHNYGPGRSMASIHAEVPNDVDIEVSHEIIDKIERAAIEELGIFLVIHMDPVETKNAKVLEARAKVEQIISALDPALGIHDFRMVDGKEQINLIFDLEVPFEYDQKKQDEIRTSIMNLIQIMDERYQCVITVEKSYVASARE